ncbi:hypothetical protein [Persephonella sp. IF05-L8]|uniref:hypothetical protein n=1 Tax=Persephonella sp. IF05-L8 TaxID=1158338 RepID=UPI0012DD5E90
MKRFILHILVIGFLFNVFHDFVFFKVDTFFNEIHSEKKDTPLKKNYFNNIHNELHHSYINQFNLPFIPEIPTEISYKFFYQKPHLKPFISKIFKPPKSHA